VKMKKEDLGSVGEARSRPKCYTIVATDWNEDLEHTRSAKYQLCLFQIHLSIFLFLYFYFCIFLVVFHFYIEDIVKLKCGDGKYSVESFDLV